MNTKFPQRMSGIEALEALPEMLRKLDEMRARMSDEASELGEEYLGYQRLTGDDDYAAARYLQRLRPHLEALRAFADTCIFQLTQVEIDPYNRIGNDVRL
jgi:hypothetical protein